MTIKFTIDETHLAGAVCSLRACLKGRKVMTIDCSLTKTRLQIDCGDWGIANIPAKSSRAAKFKISNKSLTRMAVCYKKYNIGQKAAQAELNIDEKYFETPETWIPIT